MLQLSRGDEVVAAFGWCEAVDDAADSAPEPVDGAHAGTSYRPQR
jgi:hypothetical protein